MNPAVSSTWLELLVHFRYRETAAEIMPGVRT